MVRLFSFFLGASVFIFLGYTLIGSVKIITGNSAQSWSDMSGFFIGSAVIVTLFYYSRRVNVEIDSQAQNETVSAVPSSGKDPNEPKYYRLIITADDDVCSRICSGFKHPNLKGIFEDSGYWYSNGESGPEWFTVTLEAKDEHRMEVEEALDQFLKEHQLMTGNRYWS